MADEKPRRKLILHFDARNTLFLSDKSYRFTIEEALNNYISGIVWGQLKENSEKNQNNDIQNNSDTILSMDSNQDHSNDTIERNENQSQCIKSVKSQVLNEMNPNQNHEFNSCKTTTTTPITTTTTTPTTTPTTTTTTTTTTSIDIRQPYEGENFENLTPNELANFKSTLACWNRLPIPLCIKQPQPNAISIYKLLEKQIVKITSDRGRIRKYLGNFTQTPEGLPYRNLFNEYLQMLKLTPIESINSPYCLCVNSGKINNHHGNHSDIDDMNENNDYYHYLMPAFYRLLTWLIETNRQFAIFIRTYGKDGEHILSAIEAYIHGKHSQEKAPYNAKQFLPIDYTKWYLKRSDNEPLFQLMKEIPQNDLLNNNHKQFINISNNPYDIYQIWSNQIGVIHITDDFTYWKLHNYHYKSSKPLWFNPNDQYIQHILFDDNIRFEEDGSNVIDLYQLDNTTIPTLTTTLTTTPTTTSTTTPTTTPATTSTTTPTINNDDITSSIKSNQYYHHLDSNEAIKWENIYFVQADLLKIIKNRNYFIEKVNECEFNLDSIQKQLNII
ncbi:unnamed protein product [Schistosoma spindalis]|nr:unnamed protein product [Schistosoma spindale]